MGGVMRIRPRLALVALSVVTLLAGSGGLAAPVAAEMRALSSMPGLGVLAQLIGPLVPSAISNGSDNRLTVLIVGSDWRPRLAGTGERLDAMMVMTIDGSKRISAISIPRDVGNLPIAPGVVFKPKVNGLFKYFKRSSGGDRNIALGKVKGAIAYALQIQIDYVVYLRFTGFERLVGAVGGVPVTVAKSIYDKRIVDDRYPDKQHGAKFLQSASTLERGSDAPACYSVGSPVNWNASPNCTRALLYMRSRHGKGNNDWIRAKRQQGFIFAAIQRVLSRGSGVNLEALRTSALSNSVDFYTTLPTGTGDAIAMFNLLNGATMPNQAVLKPPTYASNVPGTYKQQLKLDAVRALTKLWFGPLP
jgi:anionic cell wall polymer biosynthesis LytR-Cps2A-Psr (LCP) family protein